MSSESAFPTPHRESAGRLPVAVIGAGPVGLAAAAHLHVLGEELLLLEAGSGPAATVRTWGHVRMFSPWRHLVDPVARSFLEAGGWAGPDPDRIPTGGELLKEYLAPLAASLERAGVLRTRHRVLRVARAGVDKGEGTERDGFPFELVVRCPGEGELHLRARAVLDASGTFANPNPLGANGIPAPGEAEARGRILHGIPDIAGARRERYAGRRTAVVGRGDSALNALLELAALARDQPGTRVTWIVRGDGPVPSGTAPGADPLPERAGLRARAARLVTRGAVESVSGFRTDAVARTPSGVVLSAADRTAGPFDQVIAATGSRPDLEMLRELRLELDPRLECPVRLAPLVDPDVHTCETVPLHGHEELRQPEPGFHLLGTKSFGRAPGFLLRTGYEQVRSVVRALVGDLEGARVSREAVLPADACSPAAAGARAAPGPSVAESGDGPLPPSPATSCCG